MDEGVGGGSWTVLALARGWTSLGLDSGLFGFAGSADGVVGCMIARPPHLVQVCSPAVVSPPLSEDALLRLTVRFGWYLYAGYL